MATTEKKTTKTLSESLLEVQSKLKAPKALKNTFGGFQYRNLEGILEAVKPLLLEEGITLRISDEIVLIGERFYVKATVTLSKGEETEQVSAYAREEENKKGMDSAMVTGATSSYARKYAMNGAFLIDDSQDPDSDGFQKLSRGDDSAKPATKTTTAPKVPSAPTATKPKPWLNQGKDLDLIKEGLKAGTKTLADVLEVYNLSKVIRAELESLVTK